MSLAALRYSTSQTAKKREEKLHERVNITASRQRMGEDQGGRRPVHCFYMRGQHLMLEVVPPQDAAARVRAAIAYAGLEYGDLEERAQIGRSTIARITARKGKPRGATLEELWAIADACEVPRRFMEFGFADAAEQLRDQSEPQERLSVRLEAVEAALEQLLRPQGAREGGLS